MNRRISLIFFVVVILLFILPWVTFSCSGTTVATVSGLDLVTGKQVNVPSSFGSPSDNRIDSEPLAIVALAVAIAGVLAALVWKKVTIARSILGIVGAVALIALKFKIDGDVSREGEGMIQASYQVGYWLSILAFAVAAALGFIKREISFKVNVPAESQDEGSDSRKGEANPPDNTG